MLTLTITDPHLLNDDERNAVLLFAKIRHASPLGGVAVTNKRPATIAPEDAPDVGRVAEPLVIPIASQMKTLPAGLPPPPSPTPPVPPVPAAAITPADAIDPAKIFGGAAASGVPIPPPIPTPPAASAVPPAPASTPGSVPGATAAVPPGGVELDARGIPWDQRIHASTRGKNADGAWKKRKNVEPLMISTVEAELRALLGIPIAAPPASDAMSEDTPTTFPALMTWVSRVVAEGKLTQQHVAEVVQQIGLQSVIGLGNRPDLIPQVHAQLKAKVEALAAT